MERCVVVVVVTSDLRTVLVQVFLWQTFAKCTIDLQGFVLFLFMNVQCLYVPSSVFLWSVFIVLYVPNFYAVRRHQGSLSSSFKHPPFHVFIITLLFLF